MDLEQAKAEIEKLKKQNDKLTTDIESLKANNSSLVEEKRKETEAKQALQAKADEAAAELAKKNGDFETLAKQAQEKEQKAVEALTRLKNDIASKEIDSTAYKIANEVAYDKNSAKLLKKLIAERLQYSDDGLKILDENGKNVTDLTIEDLQKEVSEGEMFQALVKGNSATGGRPITATGRPGSNNTQTDEKISAVERINRARGI